MIRDPRLIGSGGLEPCRETMTVRRDRDAPVTGGIPVPPYSHCFATRLKAAASNQPRVSYHCDISLPSVPRLDVAGSCSAEDAGLTLSAVLDARAGFCERRLYVTSSIYSLGRGRRAGTTFHAARFCPRSHRDSKCGRLDPIRKPGVCQCSRALHRRPRWKTARVLGSR